MCSNVLFLFIVFLNIMLSNGQDKNFIVIFDINSFAERKCIVTVATENSPLAVEANQILVEGEPNLKLKVAHRFPIDHARCDLAGIKQMKYRGENLSQSQGSEVATLMSRFHITKTVLGNLTCLFNFLKNYPAYADITDGNDTYRQIVCTLQIKAKESVSTEKLAVHSEVYQFSSDSKLHYILGGVVLGVIILVQAFVIIYLKYKGRRSNVPLIERFSLNVLNPESRGSKRQYIKSPVMHSSQEKFNLTKDEDGNSLYESLDVLRNQNPPVPPVSTIPSSKSKVSSRPALPLPDSLPEDTQSKPQKQIHQRKEVSPLQPQNRTSPPPTLPKIKPGRQGLTSTITSELDGVLKKRLHASVGGSMMSLPGDETNVSSLKRGQLKLKDTLDPVVPMSPALNISRSLPKARPPRNEPSNQKPKLSEPLHPVRLMKPPKPNEVPPTPLKPIRPSALAQHKVPSIPAKIARFPEQNEVPSIPSKIRQLPEQNEGFALTSVGTAPTVIKTAANLPDSIYEEFEGTGTDNSDDEWTYEKLPKYNIYSK